jgi:catechol 2,3-dioxygenase-like lactoylglutathione lyase family enzyme
LANQSGRPIAPARKLVAAVLGTIAAFVMVYGFGLRSWAIVVLGLALLALSIALGMVNVVRRGARAWVAGTAQVKAISEPPLSSVYGRAELQIVVVAPGLPVTEVLVRDPRVPVNKWPRLGETLPITVDVDDMRRVRIDWVNAPDNADPPPPAFADIPEQQFATPQFADSPDEYDDDLLGEPEPPPWASGSQWAGPDEPPPPPPPAPASADPEQLVVHDTPAGPIVEGELVGRDEGPPPLPRRAPSDPEPSRYRPSPHPRPTSAGAATATVDPETATSASWSSPDGTGATSPQAAPPPHHTAGTAPHQRTAEPDETLDTPDPLSVLDPDPVTTDPEIDLPLDGDTDQPTPTHTTPAGTVPPPSADIPPFIPTPRETPSATSDDPPVVTGLDIATEPAATSSGPAATPTPTAERTPWADLEGGYEPANRTEDVITAYPSARPGPAGAIHGVGLTVLVTDLDRSVAFYRDTLGFFAIDRGEGNAVLASGDTRLVLRTVTDLTSAGRLIFLNLEVGDVEATFRELKAKGVTFAHPPQVVNHGEKLELWSATFHDPDGHNIAITQWRAAH